LWIASARFKISVFSQRNNRILVHNLPCKSIFHYFSIINNHRINKNPNSPKAKKARQVWPNVKIIFINFFDANGIVHKGFVLLEQTKNQQFYLKVWKWLHDNVREKDHKFGAAVICSFNTTIPPAHRAFNVRKFWAKNNMVFIHHSPHSPHLVPCDIFLFPRMKGQMKGKSFLMSAKWKRKRWRSWKYQHCRAP